MGVNLDERLFKEIQSLIDEYLYKKGNLNLIEKFLSGNIDLSYQRDVKNENELEIRTEQNQFIQSLLKYLDNHPRSVSNEYSLPIRKLFWKYSGINCDNFDKLDIRSRVVFDNPEGGNLKYFNPKNITILTGGEKVFITGLRADTYLDGSGKIIIYGPFNCASGVNIFTHDHIFDDTNKSQWQQEKLKRFFNSIIYPDCFIGENSDIFGNLNLRTLVAGKTVTRRKIIFPPYSAVGGIGKNYDIIKQYKIPDDFPPKYLNDLVENIKKTKYIKYAEHLENYFKIVKEYITNKGDWKQYQEEIFKLEEKLFATNI